jgi:hypothetical protein
MKASKGWRLAGPSLQALAATGPAILAAVRPCLGPQERVAGICRMRTSREPACVRQIGPSPHTIVPNEPELTSVGYLLGHPYSVSAPARRFCLRWIT